MSTNSVKKCKNASKKEKEKSEINATDVFVMPPNILEKLGINLENVYSPSQSKLVDEVRKDQDINLKLSDTNIEKKDNDSILETANLMKKSVFLSPTFSPTESNVISGEVEIIKHVHDNKEMIVSSTPQALENPIMLLEHNKRFENDMLPISYNTFNNVEMYNVKAECWNQNDVIQNNSILIKNDNLTADLKQKNLQPGPIFSSKMDLNVIATDIQFVQADEVYTSHYSSKTLVNSNPTIAIPKTTELKKKITILSEEKIDSAKLNTLFSPSKTILTPISANTLIARASDCVSSEFDVKETIRNCSLDHLISTDLNTKTLLKNEVARNVHDLSNNNLSLSISKELENSSQTTSGNNSEPHMLGNEFSASYNNDKTLDIASEISVNCNNVTPESQHEDFYLKVSGKKMSECVCDNVCIADCNNCKSCNKNDCKNVCEVDETYKENKICVANEDKGNNNIKLNLEIQVNDNVMDLTLDQATDINQSNANDVKYVTSLQNGDLMSDIDKESNKKNSIGKVSEMATYLSSFFKSSNKKSKNINKNIVRESDTKLSIQGVEKPGGTKQVSNCSLQYNNIRTYQRQCKTNQLVSSTTFSNDTKNTHNLKFANDFDEEITIKSCPVICKSRDFCICSDFGRLGVYDWDKLYEHIHFWNSKNVDCDLDVIFSIYNDNTIYPNVENVMEENKKVIDNSDSTILDFNICWNDIAEQDNFLMDTNLLIAHTHTEDSKQVVHESNANVAFEVSSQEDYDNNDSVIIQKDSINEDDRYKKEYEIIVILDTVNESEVVEKDEVNSSKSLENADNKGVEPTVSYFNPVKVITDGTGSLAMEKTVQNISTQRNSDKEYSQQMENADKEDLSYCTSANVTKNRKCHIETEKAKQKTSTPENTNRKRRMSSISVKKQDNENKTDTSKKKAIKCGVCKKMIQETKWESHISSEHCFVAWQDGATVDLETYLEDISLLEKINAKLKKEDTLMCTFCKLQLKKQSRFIAHVKKCFNSRNLALKSHKSEKEVIKCGVCGQEMEVLSWMDHMAKAHDYLAWKYGEPPLDLSNDGLVWEHLNVISKDIGGLICAKCGLVRKYVKHFLAHIKKCKESDTSNLNETMDISDKNTSIDESGYDNSIVEHDKMLKCGVCAQEVSSGEWMNHIEKEHNYIAWQDGEPPLNLSDTNEVKAHLLEVISEIGCLTCTNCGTTKKKPKIYLKHVLACEKSSAEAKKDIADDTALSGTATSNAEEPCECGVCSERLLRKHWEKHAMDKHYNLAWINGENAYDLNDRSTVLSLLKKYQKQNELICKLCGAGKKSVIGFYSHIVRCGKTEKELAESFGKCETCDKQYLLINKDKHMAIHNDINPEVQRGLKHILKTENDDDDLKEPQDEADMCQCAVCLQKVYIKHWESHAMKKHYNIAWIVGEPPLQYNYKKTIRQLKHLRKHDNPLLPLLSQDLNNPSKADKLLKEYKAVYGKFICKICGISKASNLGFYAHILVCGKTEEDSEQFKAFCDICKKKYMRIYEYQHMRAHRDAQITQERKLLARQQKHAVKEMSIDHVEVFDSKRNRKAAEKARNVIEKYSARNNSCDKCESTNVECKCVKRKTDGEFSDSDASVKLDALGSESNHSTDIECDENISDEEQKEERRKKKQLESCQLKTQRIPFQVTDEMAYIKQSYKELCETHLTDEILFNEWHYFDYEIVSESEMEKYMPPIKESCQVRMGNSEWLTLSRFEGKKKTGGMGVFTGGSVHCMRWAPSRLDDHYGESGHWLAIVAHLHNDQPRHNVDELYAHPALIQIWNVGDFNTILPKLTLGLAHDYGTIWAMDWCPSGARDYLPDAKDKNAFDKPLRLGLLAVACSNGKVYIYPVPYPSTIVKDENIFIKLKPAVELRLTDGEHRKLYQATSLCWSSQKGHSLIIVGYADGTVAFYDVNVDSPLLKTTEGSMVVFNPYHDERFQNSSITGLDVYPSRQKGSGGGVRGAWCAAAVSMGAVRVGGPARCARANQISLVTNDVVFSPHWPALLLAGDDALVAMVVNELEIWGQGRRTGGVRAINTCQRCARVACFTPPFIRTMFTHPISKEILKRIVAEIILKPIGAKINEKPSKDELTVKLEPNTYDEAITQYGISIIPLDKSRQRTQKNGLAPPTKNIRPDRFPLADVTSLAHCTSEAFHDRLAIGTHAGVVFFMKV